VTIPYLYLHHLLCCVHTHSAFGHEPLSSFPNFTSLFPSLETARGSVSAFDRRSTSFGDVFYLLGPRTRRRRYPLHRDTPETFARPAFCNLPAQR
jgi:hypothetical protein